MQYLIRTLTDSTGHEFREVIKARDNETFTVVEAKSKEEVRQLYRQIRARNGINKFSKGLENIHKAMQRKDSE
ncbi:DUF1381 domain-containing protein [Staphylococcus arlettae]|uniref:DUF1381 domain-containing protein n=1 Tax=Staphylococcus arlettae TaxID=29378 RepID=UPI0021CFBDD7|nr:DUF1381 domain-containing protein [Staphylococcus arlettae]UXU51822.1 DUF1381 domain-containing protein [Staphylococcus arlettae]